MPLFFNSYEKPVSSDVMDKGTEKGLSPYMLINGTIFPFYMFQ